MDIWFKFYKQSFTGCNIAFTVETRNNWHIKFWLLGSSQNAIKFCPYVFMLKGTCVNNNRTVLVPAISLKTLYLKTSSVDYGMS